MALHGWYTLVKGRGTPLGPYTSREAAIDDASFRNIAHCQVRNMLTGEAWEVHHGNPTQLRTPGASRDDQEAPRKETHTVTETSNTEGFSYRRLIKLLGMTTSLHDGEALAAIRKANSELERLGKTWDEFIMSKITIVADPFDSLQRPPNAASRGSTQPPPHAHAPPPPRTAPTRPQAPRYSTWDIQKVAEGIVSSASDLLTANKAAMVGQLRRALGIDLAPAKQAIEDAINAAIQARSRAAAKTYKPKAQPDPWASTTGSPQQVKANKFPGLCVNCKERVGENVGECFADGKLSSGSTKWSVRHLPGQCPQKAKPAPTPTWKVDDLDNLFNG